MDRQSFAQSLGGAYPALANVPIIISRGFTGADTTSLPYSYQHIPDNIVQMHNYDFSYEYRVLEIYEETERKIAQDARMLQERHQEVQAKIDEKYRKIAPGYSAKEGSFLQPVRLERASSSKAEALGLNSLSQISNSNILETATGSSSTGNDIMPRNVQNQSTSDLGPKLSELKLAEDTSLEKKSQRFTFQEFEQGLAPFDPWEQPQDDITLLKQIMGSPSNDVAERIEETASYKASPVSGLPDSIASWFPQQKSPHSPKLPLTPPSSLDYSTQNNFPSIGRLSPPSLPAKTLTSSLPTSSDFLVKSTPSLGSATYPELKPNKGTSKSEPLAQPDPEPITVPGIESLGSAAQECASAMLAMGFDRVAISNAIKLHNSDQKSVLDRLLAITSLNNDSENYTLEESEFVLELYASTDPQLTQRAKEVIAALRRLEEFGFEREKVKTALIKSAGNQETALEELMK